MTVESWLGDNNKIGVDIFKKKYIVKNETLDEWFDRVSGGNPEVRDLLVSKRFLFGGRVLANRGVNSSGSLSNCYSLGFIEDDYSKILDAAKDMGMTYKAQGGQGVSLSKLRPRGSPVGEHYSSDGIIPFMKLYNQVTDTTSQGSNRKGALMISLDARHAESMDFIRVKSEQGVIEKANISLEVDDEFMMAVEKYYESGEEVVFSEKREYSGHQVEYDIVPIKIFKALAENSWRWGDPACLFINEFRNYNLMEFVDGYDIESSNPSLRRGTLVLTHKGLMPIEELEGWGFLVRTLEGKWAKAKCFLSGKKKPLYRLTLNNGGVHYCTEEHKWPVWQNGQWVKQRTSELKPGNSLPFRGSPVLSDGRSGTYEDGLFFGTWYGSAGRYVNAGGDKWDFGFAFGSTPGMQFLKKAIMSIYADGTKGSRKKAEDRLFLKRAQDGEWIWVAPETADGHMNRYFFRHGVFCRTALPADLFTLKSEDFRRGFIDGVFSQPTKDDVAEAVFQRESAARKMSVLLSLYGVNSSVSARASGFAVSVSQEEMRMLRNKESQGTVCRFVDVVSVEETPLREDVWDIQVFDATHTFQLVDCITGNCGEQPLIRHGACCLGSLNLAEFVTDPFGPEASLDWKAFRKAVHASIRGLDEIVDENLSRHPLKEQAEMAEKYRNVGLGIMGYANMLMMLGIVYGSDKASLLTDKIFYIMFREAVFESSRLAEEKGAFPGYDERVFESRIIRQHFSPAEIAQLKWHGLRNCSLLSIAPTGSLSTVLGRSGGVEPEYAIKYTRKTIGATDGEEVVYDVFCKTAQDFMDITGETELPEFFIVSTDIKPEDRINIQGIMQQHVDTAISSTVNLPYEATVEDVENIYRQAWKRRLKGITVFRSGCERAPILATTEKKERPPTILDKILGKKEEATPEVPKPAICPECGAETYVYESGCGTCKTCGWGVCGW